MSVRRSLKLLAIILTLLATAAVIMPVYGQDEPKLQSILTLDPIAGQPIGVPVTVLAQLKSSDGGPNPNKVLILYLDDVFVRRIRTDEQGMASLRIGQDLLPGEHTIRVDFTGTQAYLPSSATTVLRIRPAELTISTIPPLANIPFALGGEKFTSDEKGVARLQVSKLGDFQLDVLLDPDTEVSPDTRVTFDRWQDEFRSRRTVTINGDISIEAGFSVSHPVSQTFVDLTNNPVDMSRIETLTLQATDGSKLTFDDGSVRWLRGGRIARRQTGLEATQIMYSVESVIINGSNTVNRYQQRFFVEPNSVWPIQLLLYHATFTAADALFGFPVGTGINVKYPDGRIEFMPFGKDHKVKIGPVPRGEYKIQVIGASGMAPETPLALSRNQELDLKVLSSLNIGIGVGIGLFGVFGLVFYGRPYLPRLAYRITRDIATVRWVYFTLVKNQSKGFVPLSKRMRDRANPEYTPVRFLRSNARKPEQITSNVQYLLPETTVMKSEQAALSAAQWSTLQEYKAMTEVEKAVISNDELKQDSHHTGIIVELFASGQAVPRDHKIYTVFDPFSHKYPGYVGTQDTYCVGSIDEIGDIYQQTYIDVYSGVALVKLYDRKDSEVAMDMLHNIVQPWFEQHSVRIENVLTDRGREYVRTGPQKKHPYEDFLAASGIYHTKNASDDPQSNDICKPFHQMIRKEVYGKVLPKRKKQRVSLEILQQAVDDWLNWYNSERPWDGQNQGETPMDRLHSQPSSVSPNGQHQSKAAYGRQEVSGTLFAS